MQAGTKQSHPKVEAHDWVFQEFHPALRPVLPAVKSFCSAIMNGAEPHWISLLGPSGIGKTLILKQAYHFMKDRAYHQSWRVKFGDGTITPQCAHIIPGKDMADWQSPRGYADYDLLYIEDIGAGARMDKGAGAVLRSRITELLQYRTGKWTMMDANLMREEIAEQLDPRIASRLKRDGSVMIEISNSVPDFNDR